MKNHAPPPRFLAAVVRISRAGFPSITDDSIKRAISPNGSLWIENLHFFHADVIGTPKEIACTYSIANFADETGLTPNASDDQIKFAIVEELAARLLGVSAELCSREYWARYIHVLMLEKNPQLVRRMQEYLRWLKRLNAVA